MEGSYEGRRYGQKVGSARCKGGMEEKEWLWEMEYGLHLKRVFGGPVLLHTLMNVGKRRVGRENACREGGGYGGRMVGGEEHRYSRYRLLTHSIITIA